MVLARKQRTLRVGTTIVALAGLLTTVQAGAADCAKLLVSGHPAYAPFVYYDGKEMRGAWMAIVAGILSDLGIPFELTYQGPWTRVLQTAAEGRIDMIAGLKEAPERQAFLSFTTTPAVFAEIAVFVRADNTLDYRDWPDLIGLSGGIVRDDRYGVDFDQFMRTKLSVVTLANVDLALKMLEAGRIDYALTGYYPGLAHIASLHFEKRLKALRPAISQTVNGFGFVTASACAKYLPAFDQKLAERLEDGTVQRQLDESLREWQLQPVDLSD